MKAPVCEVCLKSKILCKADKKKLEEGKISEADVKVSRAVYKLSSKFPPLKDVEIKRVYEGDNLIVIITKGEDMARIIGKSGVIVKMLSKEFGKHVKVVEEPKNMRELVQSIIYPVPLLGINIIYENGNETYKIILRKSRAGVDTRSLLTIFKKFYGKDAIVVKSF